jgi:4-hydroxy-3-polyprenylbenzoate decarboxylase
MKGIIVVDDDIQADDLDRVGWALSVRYNPLRSTEIIERGRPNSFDPALPEGKREVASRIVLDATLPFEWERKPIEIKLPNETAQK